MNYTEGEKVKYIGKGFIGYDETQTEMTIISKVPNTLMSYLVKYLKMEVVVYAHEIK